MTENHKYNIKQISLCWPGLTQLRLKKLLKLIKEENSEEIKKENIPIFCISDFLFRFAPLDEEEIWFFIDQNWEKILKLCRPIIYPEDGEEKEKIKKVPIISIMDRTYSGISGDDKLLDLKLGVWADLPKKPFIEAVSYNLFALINNYMTRIDKQK